MSKIKPEDHPDFVGGWVWTKLELDWINGRIAELSAEIDRLTAAQRQWVGLTDEEFKQIMLATYNIDLNVPGHYSDDYLLWNAIEAKLKEKNDAGSV